MAKAKERKRTANCLPPRRFNPVGSIEWAVPSSVEPPFLTPTKQKGACKKGLDYEARFASYMVDRFGDLYVPGPWFRYKELGKETVRWCQPDGLLFIPLQSRIIIVETKLQHTADAWWQLRQLYLPVVAKMFPANGWNYSVIEVTRWYDRDTKFPERVKMCPDVLSAEPGDFGVHIWIAR
jgi:hypothetical protein